MQLIATKILPPLPSAVSASIARSRQRGEQQINTVLKLKYCPSIDLIATYYRLLRHENEAANEDSATEPDALVDGQDEETTVSVWRLNGQKVFEVVIDSDDGATLEVVHVDWKDDGRTLIILSSDNVLRLVDSYSGKIMHRYSSISTYKNSTSPILASKSLTSPKRGIIKNDSTHQKPRSMAVSYSTHFANARSKRQQLLSVNEQDSVTLDDLLRLNADVDKLLKSHADLPRELANVDIESSLPKLACLPPAGFGMDDVFSTRASIDAIFHSSKQRLQSGIIDIVAVGTSLSTLHLRLFESFEIGDLELASAAQLPRGFTCGQISSVLTHPFYDGVVAIVQEQQQGTLHLFHIDLQPLLRTSTSLPILATKATQLHNCLRYLRQIQSQLVKEVKTAFDLPARFLRNIDEDLEKQGGSGCNFSMAAYHTIVTGEVDGVLKEWLADQLGDRGVKRWEKAVTDCLDLVRRLISENWNPAVERLGVVVSRLSGLARSSLSSGPDKRGVGIDKVVVEGLKETIDMMAINGEELVRDVNQELARFACFIRWLKWEVEAAALEDTSERLDEMREGNDHNEVMKVLEYLDGGPTNTVIKKYLGPDVKTVKTGDGNDGQTYAEFQKNRRRTSEKQQLPTLGDLLARMNGLCERLFEQVAVTVRRKILVNYVTSISHVFDGNLIDARIVPDQHDDTFDIHVIGHSSAGKGEIACYSLDITENGQASNKIERQSSASSVLKVPDGGRVSDIKFVDDNCFMVMVAASEDVRIYEHRLLEESQSNSDFELRHVFEGGLMASGMRPAKLEINGRKGRRAMAVIDLEGAGYSVFDLDSGDGDGDGHEAMVREEGDAIMTG